MEMSMSRPVMKRSGTIFAVVMLATVLATGAADAQDSRAGDASRFDQAQCLREAERMGRNMLDRLAREARKEFEAASAKVRDMLRDACAAGSVLASEEARAVAEKMVEAATTAMRSMRAALEGFYASLSDEQKRKLDAFIRRLRPDAPKPQ
jgi:LTXXQ motif family protein